MMLAIWK